MGFHPNQRADKIKATSGDVAAIAYGYDVGVSLTIHLLELLRCLSLCAQNVCNWESVCDVYSNGLVLSSNPHLKLVNVMDGRLLHPASRRLERAIVFESCMMLTKEYSALECGKKWRYHTWVM